MPQFGFPGLVPGDRWCVTAGNWLLAYHDGFAAPVVLASTHERTLDIVPLEALREHAVDVPTTWAACRGVTARRWGPSRADPASAEAW